MINPAFPLSTSNIHNDIVFSMNSLLCPIIRILDCDQLVPMEPNHVITEQKHGVRNLGQSDDDSIENILEMYGLSGTL